MSISRHCHANQLYINAVEASVHVYLLIHLERQNYTTLISVSIGRKAITYTEYLVPSVHASYR